MSRIYPPRYPTRNAGFWFVAVSAGLSYGLGALLVIGLMNNNQSRGSGSFNLTGALIVAAAAVAATILTMLAAYRLMTTQPQQITVEEEQLLAHRVERGKLVLEAEIPFAAITQVRVTDVPVEGGLFPASFTGVLLQWQSPPANESSPPAEAGEAGEAGEAAIETTTPTQEYVISSRNVCDFDELFELLFDRAPEKARGARLFRP